MARYAEFRIGTVSTQDLNNYATEHSVSALDRNSVLNSYREGYTSEPTMRKTFKRIDNVTDKAKRRMRATPAEKVVGRNSVLQHRQIAKYN